MYQLGDKVVYGSHGVCCVVGQEERVVDKRKVTYLALEPVGQGGSRFLVPTHNAAAMSKLSHMLKPEELEALLQPEKNSGDVWIRDENQRKQSYREMISAGDRQKLPAMIRALYRHKDAQQAAGKKVHLCDENFLRDAERLLANEISIVLDMEPDRAKQYLREKLKEE